MAIVLNNSITSGGPFPQPLPQGVSTATSITVASNQEYVMVDTRTNAVTVTFPTSPFMYEPHTVKDVYGHAALHNITVDGSGNNIEQSNGSFASSLTLATNSVSVTFVYSAAGWVIT